MIDVELDIASLARQIKEVGKRFGDTQEQATKRWGVSTANRLAWVTQAFGKSPTPQKLAIQRDARKTLFLYKSASRKKTSNLSARDLKGKKISIPRDKLLTTIPSVIAWVDSHRVLKNKRTRRLPPEGRKYCSQTLFNKAVNTKHKELSGTAKDGWLDAGEHIGRGQKGKKKEKTSKGDFDWARKISRNGKSRNRRKGLVTSSELINHITYTRSKHVMKHSDKREAVQKGATNTLKWYKMTMRADAKKKRTR